MKDIDLAKIFDSMKTNDISEVIIKEGGKLYEIRRGGFKQNVVAGAQQVVSAMPAAGFAQPVVQAQTTQSVASQPSTQASKPQEKVSNFHEVKSPLVGTFYASPKPDSPSFVEIGTKVSKGQTLCIVEAMKNFNEIECDVDGVVREILVKTGDLVEFGKVLFRIEA
ncbi:MAG: acetyl-CoA carboxylase, biotin carboxyl carrier protein [Spirochaetes bacterium GWD1_27_9]|nr:MAG: acetyl-CoA carboxylase, biotin carboxyl carrier protein [Spirochaetes bacterium GWB1_27_13]OHD25657.1 MAG: acetyl-CoA carboxylase, biotin carboxyl carrier protein [Spirochaetes bacterium GWC1_27_15]OHD41608.1 MAG: acetyl-CoA carboxylase, biotin carboxyl carrier protein [Spirochaetes bacterium GWD1_27_9]